MKRTLLLPLIATITCWMGTAVSGADRRSRTIDLLSPPPGSGTSSAWKSFSEDPQTKFDDVWKIRDGVLICRGTPKGYIYTRQDFADFVLRLEWRWPPGKKPGSGGVLLRMTGRHKIWPKSLEAQINHGEAGDFWGLDAYALAGPPDRFQSLDHPQFGRLTNLKKTQPAEKPPGEWNQYEIVADRGTVTLKINGQVVNRATGCEQAPGKICLTAEGDEIHFRKIVLVPRD